VGDFEPGHVDGVYSFAKDPNSLDYFASGSGDGVVKVWDFAGRQEKWQAQAHKNLVKGMCWTRDKKLITRGADRQVQLFGPYSQIRVLECALSVEPAYTSISDGSKVGEGYLAGWS
jgi:WD repeat and SOF domain-containing protein 1